MTSAYTKGPSDSFILLTLVFLSYVHHSSTLADLEVHGCYCKQGIMNNHNHSKGPNILPSIPRASCVVPFWIVYPCITTLFKTPNKPKKETCWSPGKGLPIECTVGSRACIGPAAASHDRRCGVWPSVRVVPGLGLPFRAPNGPV